MISGRCHLAFFLLPLFLAESPAQTRWSLEYEVTFPANVPLPLSIHQRNQPDIDLTARYSSEPLTVPICWFWRISHWTDSTCWSLEAVHHKIYLDDPPQEVGTFEVTHGLNLITVSRGWKLEDYVVRVGAGIVLSHPENTVRGKTLPEDQGILHWGYYVSGPTVGVSVTREFLVVWKSYIVIEAMLHAAYAAIPVADGHADLYALVARVNVGVGLSL